MCALMAYILLFASCDYKRELKSHYYYNIDSLVKAQVQYLPSVSAELTKTSMLGEKSDVSIIVPIDTLLWSTELDIFRELEDINKPINRGSYVVDHGLKDPQSNLNIKSFKGVNKQTVQFLKLYYHNTLPNLRKIEARYHEENSLYNSARILTMQFSPINNKMILTSYTIKGGQKMFMGDSVQFSIEGKIRIK